MAEQAKPITPIADFRPLYITWAYMMDRCYNSESRDYGRYGGRGISVCDRWHDVNLFSLDIGKKPSPKHQLDRIDHNGIYCPENCKWSTAKENGRNKSNNRRVTYKGETRTVSEWSEIVGKRHDTILRRINAGWSPEAAIETDPRLYHTNRKEFDCGRTS